MIDCHAHVLPEPYLALLREKAKTDRSLDTALGWYGDGFPRRMPESCTRFFFGPIAERVALLDSAGIEHQLISPATILNFPPETVSRVELVQAWNDAVSDEAEASGNRFRVLFGVPLPDVEAAKAETLRMVQRDTTAGVSIQTQLHGTSLTDSRWDDLYELWNELGLTVFVHPSDFRVPGLFNPFLAKDLGTQVEDTLAVVDLYESGVIERFENINWVVAHLGGVLSFLLGRFDEHWERDRDHRTLRDFPSRSLERIHFDTAGHDADAIRYAAGKFGHEKLVFGSDFPMVASDEYTELVARVRAAIGEDNVNTVFDRMPRQLFRM